MRILSLFSFFVVTIFSYTLFAQDTIHVPDDYTTIQTAIDASINGDIVLFSISANKAVKAIGGSESAEKEKSRLEREPAYGNMAELGFGVLGDFGLEPINEILLDEKLGFHVAFGRSEHFGGNVGPDDFSSPSEVIHLDRIYIPASQPRIALKSVNLKYPDGQEEQIINNGDYLIFNKAQ